MVTKRAFDIAVLAHTISTISAIESFVTRDGREEKIRGRKASIVLIGIKTITLLTKESTPENAVIAEDAEKAFQDAVEALLDKSEDFYTELRPGWALPSFHWTKA